MQSDKLANRINQIYQQSLKGTETTGNNISQIHNDNNHNITDLYKEDSVSSDPPIMHINNKNDGFIEQNDDLQHNQIKIFMKKAERLNQVSYRKLHEGKLLMPESSTFNLYKSSKNILQEFSIPTQRDKQIKAIYLRGSKDKKISIPNHIKNPKRTSLYKRKLTTDSKFVQTQTQSFIAEPIQIKSQLSNYKLNKIIQDKNNNSLPKKLKKTLIAIQQDQDEQFIPTKRKNPHKMFNTIALTSDLKTAKVNANSYLTNVAKAEHQFNKSVKRYSLRQQFHQPTVFNNSQDRNNNHNKFIKLIVNQSNINPWQDMPIQQQKQIQKQQKNLPIIKQKSSIHQQTLKNTQNSAKQSVIPKLQKNNALQQQAQHQTTQNSLFVQNNNNSTKRSKVSQSQFTIFKATHSNNFLDKQIKQLSRIKFPQKQKQTNLNKAQTYVQVPQVRQIAIGTDTNNFILHSKKPIHPISISFPQNQAAWITSQFQPKSQFIRNIDTKTFHIKKYKNGVYFGELSQEGCKNGKGVVFYFNGRSYQGNFVEDVKEGKGFQYMPDGSFYSGQFKKGLKQGKGIFQWSNGQVYDGQWVSGKKNGSGMWKSPKGDTYLGQWKNGKIEGFGVLTVKQGDRYEGQFKNSMKNGLGTQRYANGDTYVGQFTKNRPNGQGEYYYHNGDFYKGSFSNGLKHGPGYLKSVNQVYQGQFLNQKKCGYGEQTNQQGVIYNGNFQNGLRHGYGQLIANGIPKKGYWINGQIVQTQMGPIIQDEMDRKQSIVNIKINKKKQKNDVLEPIRKTQKIKSHKKSPKISKQKSLSPTDSNIQRACGCKRKH